MSAPPPPPMPPMAAPLPPPPPPASFNGGAKPQQSGARPDNSQLLREIERGVTLKRVPEGQSSQLQQPPRLQPQNGGQNQSNGNGNTDDIERKKKQVQDELNSTLQRRQKGERIRPHFVLPKNSTINAIYNQLQYLDSQNANNADANNDATAGYPQQPLYQAKLAAADSDNNGDGYHEQLAAAATTFYNAPNNGANGNGTGNGYTNAAPVPAVQYAATLPRASPARSDETASTKAPAGLMISHGRPNYVRPAAPVIRPPAVDALATNDRPESNDFTRTLRRIRTGDSALDGTQAVSSNNSSERTSENGSSRNSPVTVGNGGSGGGRGISNGSGASSPFIVRKNVPIVLQQQQQSPQHYSPAPTPSLDTRNDDDISNAIRRLRSVESPDRQQRDGSPANLVLYNNVVRPTPPQQQQQQQQQPQVQWTFVPNTNGSNGTADFQHTIEFTPSVLGSVAPQPKPQPPAAHTATPNWTFTSANGSGNDAGFHQTVEYPTSLAQPTRPAPPVSPIETTLDSLKKTLASVSRSPVSGRKINPNQPGQQQLTDAVTPMSPLVGANGQQDIQRKMQTLRKVDLKQDSSWVNKHNTQSPPTSPPGSSAAASTFQFVPSVRAAPAAALAAASEPQHGYVQPSPVQRQPHVIHHVIQQSGGGGGGSEVAAVPSTADVRNIVSFARDLADSPNRYPEKVVVVTKTRTEPDGRIVKETTTTTHGSGVGGLGGIGANGNAGAGGLMGGLNDDMFFQNLKFVIDENGDIRPNAFAQHQFQQL